MTSAIERDELPRAPLVAHLIEFRNRMMVCGIVFLLATGISYCFANHIYDFLVQPLAESFADPSHRRLIYTSLTEAFLTYIKLAVFAGFFISFPVTASQIYLFLSPGLYRRERKVLVPYLVAAPLLFLAGAALAYYFIIPAAWKFFVSFEAPGGVSGLPIQLEAKVGEYLSLVMQVIVIFGLSFQLPIVMTLLARAGVVTGEALARGRRYAIVIIVIIAGVITPPDIFSQIGLSIPLYLLYECSIALCRMIDAKRASEESDYEIVTR